MSRDVLAQKPPDGHLISANRRRPQKIDNLKGGNLAGGPISSLALSSGIIFNLYFDGEINLIKIIKLTFQSIIHVRLPSSNGFPSR